MVNSNSNKDEYQQSIFTARNDTQPKVREMAEWAIKKMGLQ